MKCEDAKELFSEYVSGDIETALAVSLENHITGCSECRCSVSSLKSIWSSLDEMTAIEPPQYFHENLMSRIHEAVSAEEAARAKRHASWDWRALLHPRPLAYAASFLAIVLAGMGGLHHSKASLDPIGSVLRLFHPVPANTVELSTSRAEWSPNAQGGGTLIVYLKARPESDGSSSGLNCVVNVPADLVLPGSTTEAHVTSETETSINIPLKSVPAQSSISVTLSSVVNGQAIASKTEPVTLMQATLQPSK